MARRSDQPIRGADHNKGGRFLIFDNILRAVIRHNGSGILRIIPREYNDLSRMLLIGH